MCNAKGTLCASLLLLSTLFVPAPARGQSLTSIAVAPANPTILVGQAQAFTAVGTYSDGSTMRLPTQPLAGGDHQSCAVLSDGTARCWGWNDFGQLGNGNTTDSPVPVAVAGLTNVTAIATYTEHSCAVLADGTVRCWGRNTFGQLGNQTTTDSLVPVVVFGITTAIAVEVGIDHSCALLAGGTVQCWGYNGEGQLGNDSTANSSTPVTVHRITTAAALTSGEDHTCALLGDGSIRCWGAGLYGQVGNSFSNAYEPVAVQAISNAVAIGAGAFHTCAVLSDATARCWGGNDYGELGNGLTAPSPAAGWDHTCALLSTGGVRCWGYGGLGNLGDGTATNSLTPVAVSGISTATAITSGNDHNCVVLTNGSVWCWGNNDFGQLGNGTSTGSSSPVAVGGLPGAQHVDAIRWASTAANVASISESGVALGLSPGVTEIAAATGVLTLPPASGSILGSTLLTVNPAATYTLTLRAAGTGSGVVTGAGAYSVGLRASVLASENAGSVFNGWSGANAAECSAGSVVMTADKSCTATFSLLSAGSTPAGSGVAVTPVTGVTVTFPNVTTAGQTSVSIGATGPPLPAGFQLGNPPLFYDITTTAAYTPPVGVCIAYSPAQFGNPSALRLLHYEGGAWVDATISNDTTNFVICGRVTGLSPFVVAQATGSSFYTLPPCRLLDTRFAAGPSLAASGSPDRAFVVTGVCGLPADAQAVSLNVTVTNVQGSGTVLLYRGDGSPTIASTITFRPGVTRANNALTQLATDGSGAFRVRNTSAGTLDLIVDVNGFFR